MEGLALVDINSYFESINNYAAVELCIGKQNEYDMEKSYFK